MLQAPLEIRKQYGPSDTPVPRVEWAIYNPEVRGQRSEVSGLPLDFIGYARSYTGAKKAVEEIKASLKRLDERVSGVGCRVSRLTQTAIDGNALGNAARRPMGALRQIFWKAARAQ